MTDAPGESELDELRRIAFGRTGSADDERAAAAARTRWLELEGHADADLSVGTDSDAMTGQDADPAANPEAHPGPDAGADQRPPATPSRPWWPLRRRRNLAVVVVGAFVLGAIASAGIASLRPDAGAVTSAPTSSPTRSTPGFDADQNGQEAVGPGGEPDAQPTDSTGIAGAVTRAGDARAALKWFDGKQTEADKTTGIGPLVSSKGVPVDPASTRLVQTTSVASVWVATGTPSLVNTFCLIIGNAEEHTWGTSCANAVDFTSVGLQLVYPSPVPADAPLTAVWTGTDITVSFGPG